MIDRLPQWAWEPTRKLRKSALIDLATQSGGERLAWDRLTVPELVAEITRRQTATREAHWAATNAKRAKDPAPRPSYRLAAIWRRLQGHSVGPCDDHRRRGERRFARDAAAAVWPRS